MFGDNKSKSNTTSQDSYSANTIQNGTTITGDVQSEGSIRIDGRLEGTIKTKGKLVVGASGVIVGNIVCSNANIEGKIEGKIEVSEMLVLKQTSKIEGDIHTKKLVVEEGAVFNGKVNMGAKVQKAMLDNGKELQKQAV